MLATAPPMNFGCITLLVRGCVTSPARSVKMISAPAAFGVAPGSSGSFFCFTRAKKAAML